MRISRRHGPRPREGKDDTSFSFTELSREYPLLLVEEGSTHDSEAVPFLRHDVDTFNKNVCLTFDIEYFLWSYEN